MPWTYKGRCGVLFTIEESTTLQENGVHFCCNCGGRIVADDLSPRA